MLALSAQAQTVTKTSHKKAVKTDVVTTGTLTIRKPDYICISTDGGKDQLIMDGTRFTMTMGGKQHVTDTQKNALFATFHSVLKAVINQQAIPQGDDMTLVTKGLFPQDGHMPQLCVDKPQRVKKIVLKIEL